jgi:predicted NAD-dependent protein-ADP-ribosyltransferase YbiA (DUF1768 family)
LQEFQIIKSLESIRFGAYELNAERSGFRNLMHLTVQLKTERTFRVEPLDSQAGRAVSDILITKLRVPCDQDVHIATLSIKGTLAQRAKTLRIIVQQSDTSTQGDTRDQQWSISSHKCDVDRQRAEFPIANWKVYFRPKFPGLHKLLVEVVALSLSPMTKARDYVQDLSHITVPMMVEVAEEQVDSYRITCSDLKDTEAILHTEPLREFPPLVMGGRRMAREVAQATPSLVEMQRGVDIIYGKSEAWRELYQQMLQLQLRTPKELFLHRNAPDRLAFKPTGTGFVRPRGVLDLLSPHPVEYDRARFRVDTPILLLPCGLSRRNILLQAARLAVLGLQASLYMEHVALRGLTAHSFRQMLPEVHENQLDNVPNPYVFFTIDISVDAYRQIFGAANLAEDDYRMLLARPPTELMTRGYIVNILKTEQPRDRPAFKQLSCKVQDCTAVEAERFVSFSLAPEVFLQLSQLKTLGLADGLSQQDVQDDLDEQERVLKENSAQYRERELRIENRRISQARSDAFVRDNLHAMAAAITPDPEPIDNTQQPSTSNDVASIARELRTQVKEVIREYRLNDRQAELVRRVCLKDEIVLIMSGVPGSGKTYTLVAAIMAYLRVYPDARLLCVADTNAVSDHLCDLLAKALGDPSRVVRLYASSVRTQFSNNEDAERRYHLSGGQRQFPAFEDRPDLKELKDYTVCVASAGLAIMRSHRFAEARFDCIFIDEAAKLTIAAALPIMALAKRAVLAGDYHQLKPHVATEHSDLQAYFARVSVLEAGAMYAKDARPSILVQLQINYRSTPAIVRMISDLIYKDQEFVADQTTGAAREKELRYWIQHSNTVKQLFDTGTPGKKEVTGLSYVPVPGVEEAGGFGGSLANWTEVTAIVTILRGLSRDGVWLPGGEEKPKLKVGIEAPYCHQTAVLTRVILEEKARGSIDPRALLEVGTAEYWQGKQCSIALITLSRSRLTDALLVFEHCRPPGFLSDPSRFNVLMTRPQLGIAVIASPTQFLQEENTPWFSYFKQAHVSTALIAYDAAAHLLNSFFVAPSRDRYDANIPGKHTRLFCAAALMRDWMPDDLSEAVLFCYGKGKNPALSHFAEVHVEGNERPGFIINQIEFRSVEQAYQAAKAITCDQPAHYREIMATTDPYAMKRFGDQCTAAEGGAHNFRRAWLALAPHIMFTLDYKRMVVDSGFRLALRQTGEKAIVEDVNDPLWGYGSRGTGASWSGQILRHVREMFEGREQGRSWLIVSDDSVRGIEDKIAPLADVALCPFADAAFLCRGAPFTVGDHSPGIILHLGQYDIRKRTEPFWERIKSELDQALVQMSLHPGLRVVVSLPLPPFPKPQHCTEETCAFPNDSTSSGRCIPCQRWHLHKLFTFRLESWLFHESSAISSLRESGRLTVLDSTEAMFEDRWYDARAETLAQGASQEMQSPAYLTHDGATYWSSKLTQLISVLNQSSPGTPPRLVEGMQFFELPSGRRTSLAHSIGIRLLARP